MLYFLTLLKHLLIPFSFYQHISSLYILLSDIVCALSRVLQLDVEITVSQCVNLSTPRIDCMLFHTNI